MGWLLLSSLAGAEPTVYTVRNPDDAEALQTHRRDVQFWVDLPDPVCDGVHALAEAWGACLADGDILSVEILVDIQGAIQQVSSTGRQACLSAALEGVRLDDPAAVGSAGRCELYVTGAAGAVAAPLYVLR